MYIFEYCECSNTLKRAARLRYKAYRSVQAIPENKDRIFVDAYDKNDNSKTCLIKENTRAVASIRASVYFPQIEFPKVPSFEVYKPYIEKELGLDKVIVESNRYTIHPDKRDARDLFFVPFRFIILNILKYDADYVITAVRPRHAAFYKRYLTMEVISEVKVYPNTNIEMVLTAGNCKKNLDKIIKKSSLFNIPEKEVEDYSICKKTP